MYLHRTSESENQKTLTSFKPRNHQMSSFYNLNYDQTCPFFLSSCSILENLDDKLLYDFAAVLCSHFSYSTHLLDNGIYKFVTIFESVVIDPSVPFHLIFICKTSVTVMCHIHFHFLYVFQLLCRKYTL